MVLTAIETTLRGMEREKYMAWNRRNRRSGMEFSSQEITLLSLIFRREIITSLFRIPRIYIPRWSRRERAITSGDLRADVRFNKRLRASFAPPVPGVALYPASRGSAK
jgi:hypothetical protein